MSDLACTICGHPIATCTCPETDARLKAACDSPYVMFKWCGACDRHYARCQCATPALYLRSGGKALPIPEGGFRTALGGRVIPDLTQK